MEAFANTEYIKRLSNSVIYVMYKHDEYFTFSYSRQKKAENQSRFAFEQDKNDFSTFSCNLKTIR